MENMNLVEVEYEQMSIINGDMDENSKEKMQELLTIFEDDNVIYICHPNHLFQYLITDNNTKEIAFVDWNSIDVNRMFNHRDYGCYSMNEQIFSSSKINQQYIQRKSSQIMRNYLDEGNVEYVYPFVVLEEINNWSGPNDYFVRGIICSNQDGYKIAFNPEVRKKMTKHKTSFRKSARIW